MIYSEVNKVLSSIFLAVLFNTLVVPLIHAEEKVPSDIRYMLEDLYGANKNTWPAPIYSKDLNHDGVSDWIAIKKNCTKGNNCPAEIFICKPDTSGKCPEYCYIEIKSLKDVEAAIASKKCESTC